MASPPSDNSSSFALGFYHPLSNRDTMIIMAFLSLLRGFDDSLGRRDVCL